MEKLGLVLAGGGGKGAYQIGVWKYLRECGLDKNISAIAGTSVGALNAALFIQGDYELAEHIWLNEINGKITSLDGKALARAFTALGIMRNPAMLLALSSYGVFDRDGLISIIDEFLDLKTISSDSRAIVAACLGIPSLSPTYFEMNGCSPSKMKSILCATSALPIIFPPENIDGTKYIDGGLPVFGDNFPITALHQRGCDAVIVVYLNRESIIKDRSAFGNMTIYELVPQNDLGNLFNGTLDFSPSGARSRIEAGYNDAKNVLAFPMEIAKTQQAHLGNVQKMYIGEKKYKARLTDIRAERKNLKSEIKLNIESSDDIKSKININIESSNNKRIDK